MLLTFAAATASVSSVHAEDGQCKGRICELDAYTGNNPDVLVKRGMERFKLGRSFPQFTAIFLPPPHTPLPPPTPLLISSSSSPSTSSPLSLLFLLSSSSSSSSSSLSPEKYGWMTCGIVPVFFRVEESVEDFDKVMEIDPRYGDVLWQRGLSLYYLDRFDDAAAQFQRDVRLNPRDSEEAIWNLISLARKREFFERADPIPHLYK